jgi:hypothetical protein
LVSLVVLDDLYQLSEEQERVLAHNFTLHTFTPNKYVKMSSLYFFTEVNPLEKKMRWYPFGLSVLVTNWIGFQFIYLLSYNFLLSNIFFASFSVCFRIKGTVQQKLTWVKSGINRQLIVSSCSDKYFF